MKEDFLYYLWTFRLYEGELQTAEGERVEVLSPGVRNTDSGPDFMQSRIRIASTLWAGSVEIHVKASDWYRHGHQDDPAYHGVILHVVYEADQAVLREAGDAIPVVTLKDRFDPALFRRYEDFLNSRQWISCAGQVDAVPAGVWQSFVQRCAIERMEGRNALADRVLSSCRGDWEACCHRLFARGFGGGLNDDAFEHLAEILPFSLCRRYASDSFSLEALALGQAGFLKAGFLDDYPAGLWDNYQYLSNKHSLSPMTGARWKFSRIRPGSFPTIRILQWAAMLRHRHSLVNELLLEDDMVKIFSMLQNELPAYWQDHLLPDRPAAGAGRVCTLGFARVWLINALLPLAIYYGRTKDQTDRVERAITTMESFPAEQNNIISGWAKQGIHAKNSLESQGLIQLKKKYCDVKKCVNCSIGVYLLSH